MHFSDQILAPLPGRERLYYSSTKDSSLFLCVGEVAKELTIWEARLADKDIARRIHLP